VNVSSNETGVSVALLYETRESGIALREVLNSFGAPVVYESLASALDRDALERSHANVVVVNLDAQNDPDLDSVYDLLDDERYRVVFNENEVSSGLSGSDHARWVRHLAAKVLGADIDPPRPAGAESVPVPVRVPAPAPVPAPKVEAPAAAASRGFDQEFELPARAEPIAPAAVTDQVDARVPVAADFDAEAIEMLDFDSLLEMPALESGAPAQLADSIDQQAMPAPALSSAFEVDFDGQADDFANNDILPGTDAGDLGRDLMPDEMGVDVIDADLSSPVPRDGVEDLDFDFDLGPEAHAEIPVAVGIEPTAESKQAAADAPVWSLEDVFDGTELPQEAPKGRADFGIEKLRAEEFLAPEGGDESEPEFAAPLSGLSLELIPLEEAVSPTRAPAPDHENWLDPDAVVVPKAKVRNVWVLGASIGGPEAVREFLAGIPREFPALFLLAQHLGDEFVGMMTNQLTQSTKLTVRSPTHGERVAHGDVVVVPNSHRILVDAEGVVVLERIAVASAFSPSIDRVLHDVADKFGSNAGAIIFSGMSSDAAEGARYLAEQGGLVYAQRPDTCVVSSMIDGVCETGVVSFLGSPKELAEKFLEAKA
jgi:chemosensory pili system protein ChpB (putative protein-glutamate methylesterase)